MLALKSNWPIWRYSHALLSFCKTSSALMPSTSSCFVRDLEPLSRATRPFLMPSTSAVNLTSSSFASPSRAGALICTETASWPTSARVRAECGRLF